MTDVGLRVRLSQSLPITLEARLDCARGELLALLGPSGSGKTSLLRAIAGLMKVRDGEISCDGVAWFDASRGINWSPQERRVGVVFQQYALFPHLSALENVMEAMLDLPPSIRRARARDWIERLHLHGLGDRKPAQLSGGQQQRVALARALAREPRALLLDEPFSAVDRGTRETLYEELAGLRRELSMPVLLVTHDLDEALLLADRVTVLAGGQTLQSGAPYDVLTRPDTAQVARLMGQKNVFRAGIVEHLPEEGATILEWRKRRLRARLQDRDAPGTQVTWTIPRSHLVPRAEADGEENSVRGTIASVVRLGENAVLGVDVDGDGRPRVFVSVPIHVAQARQFAPGIQTDFRFLSEGIHIMPADRIAVQQTRAGDRG